MFNLQNEKLYDSTRCNAFTCDITNPEHAIEIDTQSVDVISMIFVLSAIHPNKLVIFCCKLFDIIKKDINGYSLFSKYTLFGICFNIMLLIIISYHDHYYHGIKWNENVN